MLRDQYIEKSIIKQDKNAKSQEAMVHEGLSALEQVVAENQLFEF
jgi:hypothetical protein